MKKMISQALESAQSIEDVAEIVNSDGTSQCSRDEIAGQYAYQGAEEAGYGTGSAEIEAQLDALVEAGAEFDYQGALKAANTIKKQ